MNKAGIIFVDDDQGVLSSLRRMLHPMRSEWDMKFATSGAAALEMMTKEHFDVIVSDMRMPEMNGAQLLARVKARYPEMARLILSGHSERELAIQTINVAHQFLNKPCEMEELSAVIRETIDLRRLLNRKELCEIASNIVHLPSLPSHYTGITKELHSDNPSIENVADIIEEDPAMTVTVLRLVNSGFFGLASRINTVREAVGMLGLELLRNLMLATSIFSKYNSTTEFSIEDFSARAIKVGALSRKMACKANIGRIACEEAFIAALLCDVGLLVLRTTMMEKYRKIIAYASENNTSLIDSEFAVLGASHAELGAYMMGLWGFQDDIVEAVAWHHHPEKATKSRDPRPLAIVHVADALVKPSRCNPEQRCINEDFLASCSLSDYLPEWREMATNINDCGQ